MTLEEKVAYISQSLDVLKLFRDTIEFRPHLPRHAYILQMSQLAIDETEHRLNLMRRNPWDYAHMIETEAQLMAGVLVSIANYADEVKK